MTVSHRAAVALRDAAHAVRVDAIAALDEGRTDDYDELCAREAALVHASGWAASATEAVALQLVADIGVAMPDEDDVDTVRARRCLPLLP